LQYNLLVVERAAYILPICVCQLSGVFKVRRDNDADGWRVHAGDATTGCQTQQSETPNIVALLRRPHSLSTLQRGQEVGIVPMTADLSLLLFRGRLPRIDSGHVDASDVGTLAQQAYTEIIPSLPRPEDIAGCSVCVQAVMV
jgi:hypothetical protein